MRIPAGVLAPRRDTLTATGLALRERLAEHHIEMTGINTVGSIRNFLFADNNGMILEAAWPSR